MEHQKFHTVVVSIQLAELLKATRTKKGACYEGVEMAASSLEDMSEETAEKMNKICLSEIRLKSGKLAVTLFGDHGQRFCE